MSRRTLCLAALLLSQVIWVPATNFGGLDEWLILELASRGVVDVPYAHRPLGLLWALAPSWLVSSIGFIAFRLFHSLYALASAALVYVVVVRLSPELRRTALLTACFTIVWGPTDLARLSTVESAVYQGTTLGALLAVTLLVVAWQRKSRALLAAGALAGFVAVRCYEGTAALLLLGAPPLLLLTQERSRRLWRWTLAWASGAGLGLASFLIELATGPRPSAYQFSILGFHPDLLGWLGRMAHQYALHLLPLFTPSAHEVLAPAVAVAVAIFLLTMATVARSAESDPLARSLLLAGAVGIVLAGLAYSLVVVGVTSPSPFRLQILSAPGIALFLASLVEIPSLLLRGRRRHLAIALLGAYVVAIGTGRTLAVQREWEDLTLYPQQARLLAGLMRLAPDFAPHTLVVLVDEGGAWPASFSFHHAVQYLYERRAAGYVVGRKDTMYAAAPSTEGVSLEPWPIIRRSWRAPGELYGYDELFIVRHTRGGNLILERAWPDDLGALPSGAPYAPRGRIVAQATRRARVVYREFR